MRYDKNGLKLFENRCMKKCSQKVKKEHNKQSFKENYKNELKFEKHKLKQAGITIIALVITIIILLIFAGITISMVSNDGILGKAKNATEASKKSTAQEEMSMYLAGIDIAKEEQGDSFRLADYLSKSVGNDGLEDFLNNGEGYAQVAYNGYNFLVNLDDGTFTYIGKSTGTGVNRHLRQVLSSNNQDVPGVAMVEAGEIETEDLGWKVLSTNSDGTVNLIANTNTSFEVSLSGINGYTNGVKALNEICSKLYGNLEINGKKVLSARSANVEDFYDVTYTVSRKYESGKKIEPKINQLDIDNNGFSTDQISDYIDIENTSTSPSNNSQMLEANSSPTMMKQNKTRKQTAEMITTGNNYWLATRDNVVGYYNKDGKTNYSEDLSYETYSLDNVRMGGAVSTTGLFYTEFYNTSGSNSTASCSIRPIITVPADSISDKSIGTNVNIDRSYKNKTGEETKGYVKATSIADLLGKDIKSLNKINSGLPTMEADMTWSKLTDGGYDSQSCSFDTSKYDYYIADRATKLQVRLTGAQGYNNGVLALDTICNNLYGKVTEIRLNNGENKKVNVVLARNAKWEDFMDDSKINNDFYGSVWTTNAEDSTAPNKITSTWNSCAPTLFTQYENDDKTKGASTGFSDAKIENYNMSENSTDKWVPTSQKQLYSYERYNNDKKSNNPWLKVIYNAYWGSPNRNIKNITTGNEYWLSSRCINVTWSSVGFRFRNVTSKGVINPYEMFYSDTGVAVSSSRLRPVLQVEKE